jgi:hypothetical protein
MALKSLSPIAGRLLRGLAFLLHSYHSGWLTTMHVPGKDNIMADIALRPSKAHALFCCQTPTLSDPDFTLAFDRAFPLPTQQRWRLAMVPIWLKSNVFEMLRGKQLDLRQWTAPHGPATGKLGSSIAGSPRQPLRERPTPANIDDMFLTFAVAMREGKFGQGSIRCCCAPQCRPKIRSGRTSRPPSSLPSPTCP